MFKSEDLKMAAGIMASKDVSSPEARAKVSKDVEEIKAALNGAQGFQALIVVGIGSDGSKVSGISASSGSTRSLITLLHMALLGIQESEKDICTCRKCVARMVFEAVTEEKEEGPGTLEA